MVQLGLNQISRGMLQPVSGQMSQLQGNGGIMLVSIAATLVKEWLCFMKEEKG